LTKTTSAQRAARTAENKRRRNRSAKSATKTAVDKAREAVASKDLEKSRLAVQAAVSRVDKAVKRNIMHPNTAARRKAGLMKKLNRAYGTQTLPPRAKPAVKKSRAKPKPAAKKKE
jgi:small subunit ribosomal protein S20